MKRVIALWLVAGCDVMFKLKAVEKPPPSVDAFVCGSPDEDGDCITDDVDNCPGIANASQLAAGEPDTVRGAGDACDPDPAQSGDAVRSFWGFNDPVADDVDWNNQFGGGWTLLQGYAANANTGNFGYLRHVAVDDEDDLTIEARYIYHSHDGAAPDTRMGVLLDLPDGATGGETCWVTAVGLRIYAQESIEKPSPGGATVAVPISPLQAGDVVVIQMRRERTAGLLHCNVTINGTRIDVPTFGASGPWLTMNHAALQARSTVADVEYVTLYSR